MFRSGAKAKITSKSPNRTRVLVKGVRGLALSFLLRLYKLVFFKM